MGCLYTLPAKVSRHARHCLLALVFALACIPAHGAGYGSFTPGHYVYTVASTLDEGHVFDFLNARTKDGQVVFRGVQRVYYWGDLEQQWFHNYQWKQIDDEIAAIQANNIAHGADQKLIIQFSYKCWETAGGQWNFPDYIKENRKNGTLGAGPYGDPAIGGTGPGYYVAPGMKKNLHPYVWNPAVQARMKEMLKALGQRYDSHAMLECVNMCESSHNGGTVNEDAYGDAMVQNMINMKAAFPTTWIIQYANFPISQQFKWANASLANQIGWGGPDVVSSDANVGANLVGTNNNPRTYAFYYNHWKFARVNGHAVLDNCIKGCAVQNEDYDWANGFEQNYINATQKLHLNYMFWQAQYSKSRNTQIINFVRGKVEENGITGGMNSRYPGNTAVGRLAYQYQ